MLLLYYYTVKLALQDICKMWYYLFKMLQRVSMFLVMALSVSRTLVIVAPLYKLKRWIMISAISGYCTVLFALDLVEGSSTVVKFISVGPFCVASPLHNSTGRGYSGWVTISKSLVTMQLGLPAVATFFSFLITTSVLSRPSINRACRQRNRRASTTVAIFTGVFLTCNLPFFVLMILNTVTRIAGFQYPHPYFSSLFMSHYSWLIGKIHLTVLNSVLNPVVYYYRMSSFRGWLRGNKGFNRLSTNASSMSISRGETGRYSGRLNSR